MPEYPLSPGNPCFPENPLKPENPLIPEIPEYPETPLTPIIPLSPEYPENPEVPFGPGCFETSSTAACKDSISNFAAAKLSLIGVEVKGDPIAGILELILLDIFIQALFSK